MGAALGAGMGEFEVRRRTADVRRRRGSRDFSDSMPRYGPSVPRIIREDDAWSETSVATSVTIPALPMEAHAVASDAVTRARTAPTDDGNV